MPTRSAVLLLALFAAAGLGADLQQVKAEPNLEKRSKLATDNAAAALKSAREAYNGGHLEQVKAKVDEISASVALTLTSLEQTGKNPRKSPKWFKRAEIETRDLGRKLESFAQEMSYTDRPMLDRVRKQVQQAHDDLLTSLMEGRRK
jgi:hypothetical protein